MQAMVGKNNRDPDLWPLGDDPDSLSQRLKRVWDTVIKRNKDDLQKGIDQGFNVNEWFNTHPNAGYDPFRPPHRRLGVVEEADVMQIIHMATLYKWLEGVEVILKAGAEVNTRDFRTKSKIHSNDSSFTPLMYACSFGSLPLAKLFISHGADVNMVHCASGTSPMSLALTHFSFPIVHLLHKLGAGISCEEARDVSMQDCIQAFNDPTMKVPRARQLPPAELEERAEEVKKIALTLMEVLFENGADPNAIQGEGMPAIHTCIQGCTDDLRCLELLVSKGAYVNASYEAAYTYNYTTLTPLFAAALTRGADKAVHWLIQHGANVNGLFQLRYRSQIIGEPYSMLIHLLEEEGLEEQAFALVKAGCDVTQRNIERIRELQGLMISRKATYFEMTQGTHPEIESGMKLLGEMLDFMTQPKSLHWTIRTAMRCQFGLTHVDVIEKLPLPSALKKYVMCINL